MTEKRPDLIFTPAEFPAFIKARIVASGSTTALAEELGVTANLIYMLASGSRSPSKAVLTKLGLQVYYGFTQNRSRK